MRIVALADLHLPSDERRAQMRGELAYVAAALGEPGASKRAAEAIYAVLSEAAPVTE